MEKKKKDIINRVYRAVKQIPKGKVSTYKVIADSVSVGKVNPRYVGYLLHNNPDRELIPCHRVVNRKGMVSQKYAFGGWRKQKEKLIYEGVLFVGKKRVDLKRHLLTKPSKKIKAS